MIKKLFSLSLFVLTFCSIFCTQAMEQEIQTFCERHFAKPKNLEKTKKLTPEIQAYLEKLQIAASILDLQAEQVKLATLTVQVTNHENTNSEASKSFKPQSLTLAGKEMVSDERLQADDIINFIPQTSEACVIFLSYKHLFLAKSPHLSKEVVQLIENLMLSDNKELHDVGTLLFYKYANDFYKQEKSKMIKPLGSVNTTAKQYIDRQLLNYRKQFIEFEPCIATATRFIKVFDKFLAADMPLIKQLTIIINLYKQSEASTKLLYNSLYEQLHQAYTFLKNAGIQGNKLIKYKQNAALNRPLPQTLPVIQDTAPVRQFEEVYQELKQESQNTFSFLDTKQLLSTLNQSHKLPQSKQIFSEETEQSQTQEIPQEIPTEEPGETVTQITASDKEQTPTSTSSSSTSTTRDTGHYAIDESHEFYIEIYDRSTNSKYILYRIPGLSNSTGKLFDHFEYDERVTKWFTNPLKRLQEDGYTTPGHKYYTAPDGYNWKILLHTFAPIIDDYIIPLGHVSASPYLPKTDKNIRILGELRKPGQPTKYVYFTYNLYKKAGQWRCNHRCIEIKPKSEFLATQLEHAKYDVHFPALK